VNVDAHKTLLCNKTDNHTPEEWRFLFYNAPLFMDRFEALQNMGAAGENAERTLATLKDKSRHIRKFGLSAVDAENATQMSEVARIAESDPDPECRAQAIGILGESGNAQYLPILKKGLGADQPYSVVSAALEGLSVMDPAAAAEASVALQNDDSEAVAMTLAKLYASSPNVQQVPFFEKQLAKVDQMAAFSVFNEYGKFVTGLNDPAATTRAIDNMKAISLSSTDSQWRRFAATKALADMRNHYTETGDTIMVENLTKVVNDIKEKETDPTLKLYYGMF
jgi:aminopeptidase N